MSTHQLLAHLTVILHPPFRTPKHRRCPHHTWTKPHFNHRRRLKRILKKTIVSWKNAVNMIGGHDWGAKEKQVFKEQGDRIAGGDRAVHCRGGLWSAKVHHSKFRYSVYGWSLKLRYYSSLLLASARPRRHRIERCKSKRGSEGHHFLLSTPSLKHHFRCTFVPSFTLHSLIFHSVKSYSNDPKLPYARKDH